MLEIFNPTLPDDRMVHRLSALRDEAEAAGAGLLSFLIEVALVEAERIAEARLEAERTERAAMAAREVEEDDAAGS